MTKEQVEGFFEIGKNIFLREDEKTSKIEHLDEAIENTHKVVFSNIFEKKEIETSLRYRSPFSGKWFGSMEKLIKIEVPRLLSNEITRLQRKQEDIKRKLDNEKMDKLLNSN